MPAPAPKPKYIIRGPRVESVTSKLYTRDEDGMHLDEVTEQLPCYRMYIPHGPNGEMNSIRITAKRWETRVRDGKNGEPLNEYGLSPSKTPLFDPETGETVGSFEHRVAQDYGPEPDALVKAKKGTE